MKNTSHLPKRLISSVVLTLFILLAVPISVSAATKIEIITSSGTVSTSSNVYVGNTYSLNTVNGDISFSGVVYTTTNSSILKIVNGKAVPVAPGSVSIRARNATTGKMMSSKSLTVLLRSKSVSTNVNNLTLIEGTQYTLQATLNPSNSTDYISFNSSDKTIASVGESSGTVTAIGAGDCTITVYAKALRSYQNSFTSNRKTTVNVTILPVTDELCLVKQPNQVINHYKCAGDTTLSCVASSNSEISYQWYSCINTQKENPTIISEAVASDYNLAYDAVQPRYYFCRASIKGSEKYCDTNVVTVNASEHNYSNGICTICAELQPAVQNGDTYEISNAGQLGWFSEKVNAGEIPMNARLMNVIDLKSAKFTPIGTEEKPYSGTFDGQGYAIRNIKIDTSNSFTGLFGCVNGGTTIKNLGIASGSINGGDYTAALVGGSTDSAIGTIIIENCYNNINVNGGSNTAGIFGCNVISAAQLKINNCYNIGTITGTKESGTISGWLGNNANVSNTYNTGKVSVTNSGEVFSRGNETIFTNCYQLDTLDESVENGIIEKTSEQFASGEVAYLLNDSISNGDLVWYQTLGTDATPVFKGQIVYYENSNYSNAYALEAVSISETSFCTELTLSAITTPVTNMAVFEWYLNDENSTSRGTPIDGVTSSTCTITDAKYNGKYVYVKATGIEGASGTVYGISSEAIHLTNHDYDNGICSTCGQYEPAVLNGDTYEIGNAGQLMWFTDKVNAGEKTIKAKLTSDIDMNAVAWKGINEYGGTFDGQGYSIKNLAKGLANEARNGFINILMSSGVVKNVIFDGADIFFKRSNLGIIVGSNQGTISKCLVTNSSVQLGYYDNVGGIAGTNDGVITNCGVINTTIKRRYSGQGRTAGGVSETNSGTISNCFTYNCNFVNASADSGAIVASGTAPTNCFYYTTSTVASTFGIAKTQAEFNSGEVTYFLNGSTSEGNLIWGQTIGTDTAPIFWSDNTVYYDIQKNVYYNTALEEEIISVDITWGALEFTYTDASEGTWNPKTHEFENQAVGGWTVDSEVGDKITVTSSSNAIVNVSFFYAPASGSTVIGSFTDGENPITEPLPLAKGDEAPQTVVAYMKLSGKPDETANKTTLGTVTVTIGGAN